MAGTFGFHRAPRPVKDITKTADEFDFNINIPFKYWVHSCRTLYQESSFAMRDGDLERAYLMLYRESTIILQKLRTHPGFKTPDSKKLYKTLSLDLPRIVQELENLKPVLQERYEAWERMRPASRDGKSKALSDWHSSSRLSTRMIDPSENLDLTVDIAESELRRRDAAKRSSRLGLSEQDERERQAGSWELFNSGSRPQRLPSDEDLRSRMELTRRTLDSTRGDDGLQAQMESARRTLDSAGSRRPSSGRSGSFRAYAPTGTGTSYHYPSTARSQPVTYVPQRPPSYHEVPTRPERPPKEAEPLQISDVPPLRPEKTPFADGNGVYGHHIPPRPRKESLDWELQRDESEVDNRRRTPHMPARPPKEALPSPQEPIESPAQEKYQFKPAVRLENGQAIRYVFLSSNLRNDFLKIAEPNTTRGLEMCGMLCGSVINGALFITCLLIPEQKCTSDTCETVNESGMLDYCINEDLLIIGWIHTHPTQTCFMSSRDLHTQAGYQVMMPESIAIVCAPKYEPSYGIFRLTNPPGLPHILQCSMSDTFHQHSIDNLYKECMSPAGHVHEVPKLSYKIHDLRPK